MKKRKVRFFRKFRPIKNVSCVLTSRIYVFECLEPGFKKEYAMPDMKVFTHLLLIFGNNVCN